MPKSVKSSTTKPLVKAAAVGATVVRNAKTGRPVIVKGVGALKGDAIKIRKGVSLLKPIAGQALVQPSAKGDARRSDKRKVG